ncbi:AMP-binding enzyme [Phaeosphaeriaceae sp. PMI808]|nr:AMP-binding enzyme [Phaeosphaeriaceae sp. PMI808]
MSKARAANSASERLLPSIIDDQALSHPNDIFYSIPKDDDDLTKGFTDISCGIFANAINHAAIWLNANVGKPSAVPSEVIAYQGPNDLRYPILAVAAAKVGKQMLVPFPLAPPIVKQHLLASSNCKFMLHTAQENDQVKVMLQGSPHIQPMVVPDLDAWLNAPPTAPYPYPKSWPEGKDDPWLIFHTSGTTGFPKLISYTNRMMTSFCVAQSLPESKHGTQFWHTDRRCYAVVPMSHFSGLCAALQTPTFLNGIVISGSKTKPPTPTVVAETLRYSKAQGLATLPFLLRGMVQQAESLQILKQLEYIQWVGAALDMDTGSKLSKYVKLCPAMGTTECGPFFLNTVDDAQDWAYYSFQSGQGIHFAERADNLYELVFKKSPDAVWQQVFIVFPDLELYETKDLFQKHPSREGLWSYIGRSDDVIVLSNSANINATVVEEKLMAHPDVQMALVGGSGRDYSFAIIELTSAASEELEQKGLDSVLNAIAPAVNEANRGLSPYTRLRKEFILVTTSKRGLVKSPKGSVMRGPSTKAFEKDIEALFSLGG